MKLFLNRQTKWSAALSLTLVLAASPTLARIKYNEPSSTIKTDAYTAAGLNFAAPDANERSVYNIAFRAYPKWMDEMEIPENKRRFVFFGLDPILAEALAEPVTAANIETARQFFQAHGFHSNIELWERVVKEHQGRIPVTIRALQDGAVFFKGEPVIQVEAADGFGELAAWLECQLLQISAAIETATAARFWLEYNTELIQRTAKPEELANPVTIQTKARMQLADFSYRSRRNTQEATQLGLAFLTSHMVSSTLTAVELAHSLSPSKTATAKPAMYSLAHRIVMGYKEEGQSYRSLRDFLVSKNVPAGSFVSDTYDHARAIKDYLAPMALERTDFTIYARPDSGDALEAIMVVLNEAVRTNNYEEITSHDGKKYKRMKTLRVIQADGMSFKKIREINEKLLAAGFSPTDCVVYGMGGHLADMISRSNTSAAMKLAAVGNNGRHVMKMAPGKNSIPGITKIVREQGTPSVRYLDEAGSDELVLWYDGTHGLHQQSDFGHVQKKVLGDFFATPKPSELLSDAVKASADELISIYKL